MPKSKRSKIVSLTNVKPATRDDKENFIEKVTEAVESYEYIYILDVINMRNVYLQELRKELNDSKFFFGKNKLMTIALGATPEEAKKKNLDQLAKLITGEQCLLFTNRDPKDVERSDYARPGSKVNETVVLPAGILYRGEETFPSTMEPSLRKLGLNTHLERGIVALANEHVVCKSGDKVNVEQAHLLRHLFKELSYFRLIPKVVYYNGEVKNLI